MLQILSNIELLSLLTASKFIRIGTKILVLFTNFLYVHNCPFLHDFFSFNFFFAIFIGWHDCMTNVIGDCYLLFGNLLSVVLCGTKVNISLFQKC